MRGLIGVLAVVSSLAVASNAAASVTFGADLTTGDSGVTEPCSNWTYSAAGPDGCVSTLAYGDAVAPIKGVITSFSMKMADAVTGRLRLAHLDNNSQPDATTLTFKGTGDEVSIPGDSVAHSFPARLSVQAGDVIGFASTSAIHRTNTSNHVWRLDRDTPDGSTGTMAIIAAGQVSGYEVPINATIEGDADGDGYGDETQDLCPSMASTHDACPGTQPAPGTGGSDSGNAPPPAPPVVLPDTLAPVLSPVTIDHRVFRAAKGAKLRFLVSEAGSVHLSIYALRAGRRSGRRCVAPAPRRSRGKPCTKQVLLAGIDNSVVAERNVVAVPGRVHVGSRLLTLAPGRYRVDVQARDAAGNRSNTVGVAFKVVR